MCHGLVCLCDLVFTVLVAGFNDSEVVLQVLLASFVCHSSPSDDIKPRSGPVTFIHIRSLGALLSVDVFLDVLEQIWGTRLDQRIKISLGFWSWEFCALLDRIWAVSEPFDSLCYPRAAFVHSQTDINSLGSIWNLTF